VVRRYPPIHGFDPKSPGVLINPPPPPPGWTPLWVPPKVDKHRVSEKDKTLNSLEGIIDTDEIQKSVEEAVKAIMNEIDFSNLDLGTLAKDEEKANKKKSKKVEPPAEKIHDDL